MLSDLGVPRYELVEIANNAPSVADAIARLYTAVKEVGRNPELAGEGDARALVTPENWVRDYIQQHRNHYPDLEDAARDAGRGAERPAVDGRADAPAAEGSVGDQRVGGAAGRAGQRQPDLRRRPPRIFLMSSQLRAENRTFALAYQLALVEFAAVLERMVAEAAPPDEGIRQLLHMSLANYAAGAIMMPYGRFLASAEAYRYSIDRLCGEYGANVEQIAHRFTTLNRPGRARRPVLHAAGRSGREHLEALCRREFPFSRFGGTCPRWNMHAAFQAHGQVVTQIIETPDGQRYFTVSRTIERPIKTEMSSGLLAIGLGCDIRYAHKLSCADVYDLAKAPATWVGPGLRASARASTAPIARRRRPGGCWRSTGRRNRSRPSRSSPPRARPAPARARRGPNSRGRRRRRRSTARIRRAFALGSADARTSA